jgi:pyruvate formate lyase activating enzyme
MSGEEIMSFLKKRSDVLDGVVITGGEPLMHEEIIQFAMDIKDLGYMLKIDTNGAFPEQITKLLELGIVDYWAMDIKNSDSLYLYTAGIKAQTLTTQINTLQKIHKSIDLIMGFATDYELRTTFVPGFHNKESVESLGRMIKGAKRFYIQNFRNGKTLDASFRFKNGFTPDELLEFKVIIEKYVEEVVIR